MLCCKLQRYSARLPAAAQGGGEVMLKVPILKLMPPINMLQEGEPTAIEHELAGPCLPLPAVPSDQQPLVCQNMPGQSVQGAVCVSIFPFPGKHVLPCQPCHCSQRGELCVHRWGVLAAAYSSSTSCQAAPAVGVV